MYKNKIKRIIDFILALGGLIVLSPVFIILCIWIKLDSKGPILFKQRRVGINKTYFNIYKFRTMYIDTPKDMPTHMLSNPDQYITKSGKFLRKTSLDEFPQFFNVLKGDMSLVGTRPPTVDETKLYDLHHYARLAIKPGITGMWQISGRSDITDFEEVVRLDKEYIERWNPGLDVKILLKTFGVVLKKQGSM